MLFLYRYRAKYPLLMLFLLSELTFAGMLGLDTSQVYFDDLYIITSREGLPFGTLQFTRLNNNTVITINPGHIDHRAPLNAHPFEMHIRTIAELITLVNEQGNEQITSVSFTLEDTEDSHNFARIDIAAGDYLWWLPPSPPGEHPLPPHGFSPGDV